MGNLAPGTDGDRAAGRLMHPWTGPPGLDAVIASQRHAGLLPSQ
jgi:hypothetical protein